MNSDEIKEILQAYTARRIKEKRNNRASVAIILRENESAIEILFIKRSENPHDPWSGHMAFPGGRFEEQDGSIEETVIREVEEEIGLNLNACAIKFGNLDDVRAMARGKRLPMVITPFVFGIKKDCPINMNEEVVETHWIPLEFFKNKKSKSTLPYLLKGITIPLPCYRYKNRIIWGLTYKMLHNFFTMLDQLTAQNRAAAS